LVSDFRYQEELAHVRDAELADVFIRSRSMIEAVAEVLGPAPRKGASERAPDRLDDGGSESGGAKPWGGDQRIGIQAEHMPVAERASIARRVGPKRVVDTTGLVNTLRVIKDASEIDLIRKAIKIQEAALKAVLPTIKPGQTEQEIAARLEMEMKTRGSSEPGFQTIVAAGANSSLPHYRPAEKKTAKNNTLLIDWGAVYKGYHGDMTRSFALGKWPKKIEEIFKVVLEAQQASAAALAPGKTTKEIDQVARSIIEKAGFGDYFGHGLGHGLGLNGHEDPRLTNMLSGSQLRPGMVVTVEPGIYLPGEGGVRIEDDYVLTEKGAERLCSLPKTLDWGTL
jgi:Xaa-Pro aminopeptidase